MKLEPKEMGQFSLAIFGAKATLRLIQRQLQEEKDFGRQQKTKKKE